MGSALPAEEIQRQMLQILHGPPPKRHASPDDAQSQPKRRCTPEAKSVDDQLADLEHTLYHGKQSVSHMVWNRLVADAVPNPYPRMADAFKALHQVYWDYCESKNKN